ncbi:MAG: response regulator [Deltaproteobacteria bacterium]|nr:response regulator [Deltaproteobacteria bacterium]TLN01550.1 MAG: response regulator [bacterium]
MAEKGTRYREEAAESSVFAAKFEKRSMTMVTASEQPGSILIVDDSATNLRLLSDILTANGYEVIQAQDGVAAMRIVQSQLPDLILLDIVMPDLDGFKVCQFLKSNEKTRTIPVIFMTSLVETSDKIRAFRMGAADYITKPFQAEEVLARAETLLSLHAMRKKLEARNRELLRANEELASVNVELSCEIMERKQAEAAVRQYQDHLEDLVRERTAELAQANTRLIAEVNERTRAEEKVLASLREKEILLKEIHHRVKNNLQIISSLLELQCEYIHDEQPLRLFRESQDRIKTMALVHEQLYATADLASINVREYLESLTKQLVFSYVADPEDIKLDFDVAEFCLGIEEAIPCGLIVNELVSNSLKHAFPEKLEGKIAVTCRTDDENMVVLTVSDSGVGIPEGLDLNRTETLGMQIVCLLTKQLRGTIKIHNAGGASFAIRFPLKFPC